MARMNKAKQQIKDMEDKIMEKNEAGKKEGNKGKRA